MNGSRAYAMFTSLLTVLVFSVGISHGQKVKELGEMAQFGVSPSLFELNIGTKPSVHSLRLMNMGVGSAEVKVSVVPWSLNENNQIEVIPSSEQTLDQWIVFNPGRFTIAGKSTQTVRFSIRPRVRPQTGEHRAMIYLEQILPEAEKVETIRINFKVGVAVYAYVGDVERSGTVDDLEARADEEQIVARLDVQSVGNAHVRIRGDYYVWPVKLFPGEDSILNVAQVQDTSESIGTVVGSGKLPSLPVLPGTRRSIPLVTQHSLEPGEYVLAMIGNLSGIPFSRSTSFIVPAVQQETAPLNQVAQVPGGDK